MKSEVGQMYVLYTVNKRCMICDFLRRSLMHFLQKTTMAMYRLVVRHAQRRLAALAAVSRGSAQIRPRLPPQQQCQVGELISPELEYLSTSSIKHFIMLSLSSCICIRHTGLFTEASYSHCMRLVLCL